MSNRTVPLTEKLYRYLIEHSLREAQVLRRLREETLKRPMANMQISPEQGQFMQLIIRLMGARRTLEVGVFTGYSSLAVALALPPDGRIVACDVSDEWTSVARRYWQEAGVEHKIDLRLAPALDTLQSLLDAGEAGRFDFAFIDADKENYGRYYDHALRLLRPGGVIAVDNTLWGGAVADGRKRDADTRAIREFNRRVHADPRVEISLVPIGDGLTLALKHS